MSNETTAPELSETDLLFFTKLAKLEEFLRENDDMVLDAVGDPDYEDSYGFTILVVNKRRYQFFNHRDGNGLLCLSPEDNIMLAIEYERFRGRR